MNNKDYRIVGDWVIDINNNNIASISKWVTPGSAIASLETLKGCYGCIDCWACTDCSYCYQCQHLYGQLNSVNNKPGT